ncbi:hypothetical protein [Prosthecobacter sp.]|uniref:hypothetical protein n=1 Tax=Prosthecobacter sp. TaxID=1965333 RepID=UPI002489FD03|nr:hypothetical protein [Prosthecobacter sp.]MDI1313210.1 hypothetical protein [Prosthecobacter sp.]
MTQEHQILLFGITLVSGLFLISLIRLFRLSRANRRMGAESIKMEKQAALKDMEVTAIHHDAMSWRAKTQRQFEALRGEFSHRLQQSDQGGMHVLKEWEEAQKKEISAALAKISELEAALSAKPVAELPAKEILHIQSLESELAAAKAEIASGRQQNVVLQRDLLLSRRKGAAPAVRKSSLRSA